MSQRPPAVALALITALVCAASAGATTYAPVDQPGPPLSVPVSSLQAAMVCSPDVGHSDREPVLLVPGTWTNFKMMFSWNLAVALSKVGIPWCGISPPHNQTGDIQTAAEYDVYAIRYLYHASGDRKIAIVGHSQGGMQPRWALRFWPDTREMVADDVGIAPDNQGASLYGVAPLLRNICDTAGECPLTVYQQAVGSNFIQALNSGSEMFPGIDYTVVYSTTDEVVAPPDTILNGPGSYERISLQQICPGHIADHLLDGSIDPITWALVLDAITHPGPAVASRIPTSVCSELINPELNAATVAATAPGVAAELVVNIAASQLSTGEPPLRCYVTARCPATTRLRLSVEPSRAVLHRRTRFRLHVTVNINATISPVPDAAVWIGNGRRLHTNNAGRTSITLAFGKAGPRKAIATAAEYLPVATSITVRSR